MWELQQLQELEQTDPELVQKAIGRLLDNDLSLKRIDEPRRPTRSGDRRKIRQ